MRPDSLPSRKNTLSGNRSAWMWPRGSPTGQPSRMVASAACSSAPRPSCTASARASLRASSAGQMQAGDGGADRSAMLLPDATGPDAGQEGGDRRMPAAQMAKGNAVARLHGQRASHAAFGQMLHQPEEPGQVLRIDALFVERQDEVTLRRFQRKV